MTTPNTETPAGTVEAIKAMSIADLQSVRPDLVVVDVLPDQEARESILEEFERLKLPGVTGAALRGIVRESVSDPIQVRFENTLHEIVSLDGLEDSEKERAAEALATAAKGCGIELVIPTFASNGDGEGDGEGDGAGDGDAAAEAEKVAQEAAAGGSLAFEGEESDDDEDEGESDVEKLEAKLSGRESLDEAIAGLKVVPDVQVELNRRLRPKVDALVLRGTESITKAAKLEYDALMRVSEAVAPNFQGTETDGEGEGTESESTDRAQSAAEVNVGVGEAYGAPATRK